VAPNPSVQTTGDDVSTTVIDVGWVLTLIETPNGLIVPSWEPGGGGGGGVTSLSAQGDPKLIGDVTLSAGSNVTLVQSGQNIEIEASGSGGGSITLVESTDASLNVSGGSGPTVNLAVENSPAIDGVTVSGTAANGKVLTATSSSAADWQTPTPGGVTSFNTRTGAVTAQTGDYTAAEVTNAADLSSASQQDFTAAVQALALIAAGLTGATAASRYVGATVSGAPVSGSFDAGDFVIDQTGVLWIYNGATWVNGSQGPAGPAGPQGPLGFALVGLG
jgi:hypothetical protein